MTIISRHFCNHRQETLVINKHFCNRRTNNIISRHFCNRRQETLLVSRHFCNRRSTWLGSTLPMIEGEEPCSCAVSITIKDVIAGTEISIYQGIKNLNITRSKNAYTTWSVTFADNTDNNYSPLNTSAPNYTWFQLDIFNTPWEIKRLWFINVKVGDDIWISPGLVLLNISRKITPTGYETTYAGLDISRNLLQEDQTRETYISENAVGKVYKIHDIIGELLKAYGIDSYDLSGLDNPPVRKVHIQGQAPIDVINRLINIPVGYWYIDGMSFVAKQSQFDKGKGATWYYVDKNLLEEVTFDWSIADLINEIRVVRTQETAGVEEFEKKGENACGLQLVTFTTPRFSPMFLAIESRHGTFENIDYLNADGKYQSEGGLAPFTQCQFVFKQTMQAFGMGMASGQCEWKIQISGMTPAEAGGGLEWDEDFNILIKDQASQDKYGLWSASSPISDPLIPDSDWAKKHGKRKLWEAMRLQRKANFKTPTPNPWLNVGDIVSNDVQGVNFSGEYFSVESTNFSFSGNKAITTFSGTQYPEYYS